MVVGFGISGGCAALEAARAGARVVLLERAAVHGGTSAMSGGHFYLGGGTAVQKATGIEDYNDYSISVNRDFGPVNAALGFYGTDADGEFNFGETADNRFVLTLSIGG